jgi:hypothetical protein
MFLYVEEAHADDEWPIATPAQFAVLKQHRELGDRVASIRLLQQELPGFADFPMYADSMTNEFQRIYGAWPTRMYLFNRGELVHKADAVNATFDLMSFWQKVAELK